MVESGLYQLRNKKIPVLPLIKGFCGDFRLSRMYY